MEQIDEQQLTTMLMRGATGMYLHEAAVRLLLRHGYWLRRRDFRNYIDVDSLGRAAIDFGAAMAALDRGELVGDDESQKVLRIAASMSGVYPVHLREVVEGIDRDGIKHIAEAIMYADGFLNSTADVQP